MSASFLKYLHGHNDPSARTPEGYPIRGNVIPFLKPGEEDEIQISLDTKVQVFKTNDAQDLAEYTDVLDRIANGLYVRVAKDLEEFLEDEKCWVFCVRYAEVKGDVSRELMRRTGGFRG